MVDEPEGEGGGAGVLDEARAALARCDWSTALDAALGAAVGSGVEAADRLDIVAEAHWWLGHLAACIDAREECYSRYDALGHRRRAGQCAVWLWEHYQINARGAIAGAWLRRARRVLDGDVDAPEYGALVLREAELTHGSGDLAGATVLAREVLELGRRLREPDLEAQALQTIGRILIDQGHVDEGLGHLDEAMLSVVEGKLSAYTTGKVYCSLISACESLGDLRRAAEWTEATQRWSTKHPLAMWPGICRVHHAALLQLRGDWGTAEREARRACDELDGFHVGNVASGYVEIGEIRRRLGDLDGAEEAFVKAEELCGQPSAGLALVRLAQGRVDAASAIVTPMLADQTWNQLARAKLLPARVQIAVAAGDLDTAADAVSELEAIAVTFDQPVLFAAALTSRARVQLARGDAAGACATLQEALARWLDLEVPYEVATVRLLLGQACRNCGDEDAAIRSFGAAGAIFDKLGAALDAHLLLTLTEPEAHPAGLTGREVEVLRLVAAGLSNRDIAAALHLSERTVARHLSNTFAKVGVSSRTAAAAFAFKHGIGQPA